ncbi:hypothetical protein EA472_08130 [Natrarchaeobius oligotrophus]|uniref:PGF-CTERM archaeal protein-sorting signal domain-containing protein n=1 Tax=Natrarchaeobius chitinivorans TaxID=1679083 RepID=A0A3N6MY68_NATCH|nr:hypothetical protein EA472_08130 [Natrarchaeobius chitinivorans]
MSIEFHDQETDGTYVVIESLYTEADAEVIIFHAEGDREVYRRLILEGGVELSNERIELDEPIPETQLISISVQPPEGGGTYGGSRATVTVDGSRETPPSENTVRIDHQETIGTAIVVQELSTVESGQLEISSASFTPTDHYTEIELAGGETWTDELVELSQPLRDHDYLYVTLRIDGQARSQDRALVTAGVPPVEVDPNDVLPEGYEHVPADVEAGFHYPYVLYRPAVEMETERPLFVGGLNSPTTADRLDLLVALHTHAASFVRDVESLNVPVMIAGFPRTPEDGSDLVQSLAYEAVAPNRDIDEIATDAFPADSLQQIDEQTVAMIDDARRRLADERYDVTERVHMDGFSSGANFADRMALLHPDYVSTISIGGNGAFVLPLEQWEGHELRYPIGVADYETLTGREFDIDSWRDINRFIYLGREDQPEPGDRGYHGIAPWGENGRIAIEIFGKNRVTERFPTTKELYEDAGASAEFKLYEGVGHRTSGEMRTDVRAFHRNHMDAQHATFDFAFDRSHDRIAIGKPITVTGSVENLVERTATATLTLRIDGESVETTETEVAAGETADTEFTHTFDSQGEYTLRVNGTAIGDTPVEVVERSEASPGFGAVATLGGIAGASYLAWRRTGESDT